ncbi:unnamed protein product [Paramecium octaurelia]|uniref:Uncharacterized protein n=1 Tax=Paramecium octaurelia TaxID=43137 RepID=A0A8S1S6E5_PAROT|nr:unnamed protein product [Paramecium octaurelia]
MTLYFILLFLDYPFLMFTNGNCKYQNNQELRVKSILRSYYKDVASESNGAIISSAKFNKFYGISQNMSPLRDSIYSVDHDNGHIVTNSSIVVSFASTQEINQIIVWFYDLDGRKFNPKITVQNKDNIEKVVFEDLLVQSIVKIKFPDQMVSSIKLSYMEGGTLNDLVIIKIQAFYARRNWT